MVNLIVVIFRFGLETRILKRKGTSSYFILVFFKFIRVYVLSRDLVKM